MMFLLTWATFEFQGSLDCRETLSCFSFFKCKFASHPTYFTSVSGAFVNTSVERSMEVEMTPLGARQERQYSPRVLKKKGW